MILPALTMPDLHNLGGIPLFRFYSTTNLEAEAGLVILGTKALDVAGSAHFQQEVVLTRDDHPCAKG